MPEGPARQRDDYGVQLRHLLQQLQPNRALPGDDERIVKRRDRRQALLLRKLAGVRFSLVLAGPCDDHLRPKPLHRLNLMRQHQIRHTYNRESPTFQRRKQWPCRGCRLTR